MITRWLQDTNDHSAFHAWRRSLRAGFRFDYEEDSIRLTVEVKSVDYCDELIELELLVIDATHSRPSAPLAGEWIRASCHRDDYIGVVWLPHPEGHFARAHRSVS